MICRLCKRNPAVGAVGHTERVTGKDDQGRKTTDYKWVIDLDVCKQCMEEVVKTLTARLEPAEH